MKNNVNSSPKGILVGINPIIFYPPLAEALDTCGALLIQQLHYWLETAPHENHGRYWIYNSYGQWAEALGYSEKTISTSIKKLKKLGILEIGVFNANKYDQTRWYSLNYERLKEVLEKKLGNRWQISLVPSGKNFRLNLEENSLHDMVKNTLLDTDKITLPIPETISETTSKTQTKITQACPTLFSHDIFSAAIHTEDVDITTGGTSKDLVSVPSMYMLWKKVIPLHFPTEKYIRPFTEKQKGQVKQLIKIWEEDSHAILIHIVKNWIRYVKDVEFSNGIKSYPSAPKISFLLQYAGEAKNHFINYAKYDQADFSPKKIEHSASSEKNQSNTLPKNTYKKEKSVSLEELLNM